MKMQIGKWGNSLAVRLPRDLVERFDLKEGDSVDLEGIVASLEGERVKAKEQRRQAALAEIAKGWLTLPPDWKFDREDANWRPAMDRW